MTDADAPPQTAPQTAPRDAPLHGPQPARPSGAHGAPDAARRDAAAAAPQAAPDHAPEFDAGFRADLDRLFLWRRDVRRFRADPLPAGALDALLLAAASAPSVGLSEPWRFVKVESAAARAAVTASFEAENAVALAAQGPDAAEGYARLKLAGLREAPGHLAVFCDEATAQGRGLGARTMPEMRRYSVVCAVMQLWLAARAAGLGVGWVSILDPDAVGAALGAPADWRLVAYLCIGRPEEVHADAELERLGWERRRRLDGKVTTA